MQVGPRFAGCEGQIQTARCGQDYRFGCFFAFAASSSASLSALPSTIGMTGPSGFELRTAGAGGVGAG
jgi:hypothetical protein